MDGMETTRRIRGNGHSPQSLPIIALSAHTDSGSHIAGLAAGMNDYLTKPVDPVKLRDTAGKMAALRPPRRCGDARRPT